MNALTAPKPGKSGVGRADLLRALATGGPEALEALASVMGYERGPAESREVQERQAFGIARPAMRSEDFSSPPPAQPTWPRRPPAKFFYLAKREAKPDAEIRRTREGPAWLKAARRLAEDERPSPSMLQSPAAVPLTRWSRLWPFLRRSLGRTAATRQLDVQRLVRAVTRGQVLPRVPMQQRQRWSPRVSILVDYSSRTLPFWDDFNRLITALQKLHGSAGLDVHRLDGPPGREIRVRRADALEARRWKIPEASTPLLILSDLGQVGDDAEIRRGWQRLGTRLRAAGLRPPVLFPIPESRQDPVLQRLFALYEWDVTSRFLRPARPKRREPPAPGVEAAERLLVLASPCIRVEPALLRALRGLLPANEVLAIDEAEAWRHEDVAPPSTQGFGFANRQAVERLQAAFRDLDPRLQQRVVALVLRYHRHLPASIRYPELLTCERLAPGSVPRDQRQAAERWARDIVKTCTPDALPAGLCDWLHRHVARQPDSAWVGNDELVALWALTKRAAAQAGAAIDLPPGGSAEQVAYFLGGDTGATHRVALVQRGPGLVLCDPVQPAAGSPLGEFTIMGEAVGLRIEDEAGASRSYRIPVRRLPLPLLETLAGMKSIEIDTGLELLFIERESWRSIGEMGRDRSGFYVDVPWLTERHRLVWKPPQGPTWADAPETWAEWDSWGSSPRGRWVGDGPVGWDDISVYADLTVAGITQRFRWIAPGTFMMGSPEDEPERSDRETLHEVTLTRGFWLADTACTQALWTALMGENPSKFQDNPENPVENVSWDDAQVFIAHLNKSVAGLNARLPTEAEWEYACRAGTGTPFSFGSSVTPDQVNYNGTEPYADGPKGLYRRRTVPVKALPANCWGLHQMHGNVWEWCADWLGSYREGPAVDPLGPYEGAYRALRGGSWIPGARNARSAYRGACDPSVRSGFNGVRLALGPASPEQAAERRQGSAPGRAAASERGGAAGKPAMAPRRPNKRR